MKIKVITVGKRQTKYLDEAVADYQKRLRDWQVEWLYIKPAGLDRTKSVELESEKILSQIKPNDYVILLDENGQEFDNLNLSSKFNQIVGKTGGNIVIIIGGSYGVSSQLKTEANLVWSLSKLVLPHQLVRLVLVEQLYRTKTILNNQNYHH